MTFQQQIQQDKVMYDVLRDEKYFIESYSRVEEFLLTIREEKVWKTVKYSDALFSYEQIKTNVSFLFHPLIDLFILEIKFLRWILCPIEAVVIEFEESCDLTLERISILKSTLPMHILPLKENYHLLQTMQVEYLLIESEITLFQAIIDLKQNNFTASAHKFLKSYQKMTESKNLMHEEYYLKKGQKKYQTAYFLQMYHNRSMVCDQQLLQSLYQCIQEKLNEIRLKYPSEATRKETNMFCSAITDETLQTTRDLLHLKQLYKELTTEYQKMDEEKQIFLKELEKPSKKSVKKAFEGEKENENFENRPVVDENVDPNMVRSQYRNLSKGKHILKSKSLFEQNINSWSIAAVSESCGTFLSTAVERISTSINNTSTDGTSATTTDSAQNSNSSTANGELVNSIMSPKKIEMPVVSVLLPRLSDVAKMFDFDNAQEIRRRKSQHQVDNQNRGIRFGRAESLAHLDLAQATGSQNSSLPSRKTTAAVNPTSPINIEDLDFVNLHDIFENDFFEKVFIQSKSRIALIDAIFAIGLSFLPENSQWVFEIVNVSSSMDITKALSSLYKLHLYDHHRWNKLATLVLINLPLSLYQQFWNQAMNRLPFIQDITFNTVDQFYKVIEAQSIIKPWTAKNPLWLTSMARQSTNILDNAIMTNIHKRIDYYRRVITLEADVLSIEQSSFGFYEIRNSLSRDLLNTGNWILSLQQSRELTARLVDSLFKLHNYTIIQSSSAALIVNEFFNCQKIFLPLKFANKFIYNVNVTSDTHYHYHEMSDIVATLNFQQSLGSMKQYASLMKVPFEYQTVVHRISEYEDYYAMLQTEMKQQLNVEEEDRKEANILQVLPDTDKIISEEPTITRKEESLKVDYYCFWCWLMPIETIYLLFRSFGLVQEAAHSSLLNLCDKGGLLFADKYLLQSLDHLDQSITENEARVDDTNALESEQSPIEHSRKNSVNRVEEPFQQMGYFIKSIIVDEIILKDPSVIRKAIYPTNKLKLYFEEIIVTGEKQLRIDCDDNYSPFTATVGKSQSAPSSALHNASGNSLSTNDGMNNNSNSSFLQMLQGPSSSLLENPLISSIAARMNLAPNRQAVDMKAMKILQKIKERHEHYNSELLPFYKQAYHLTETIDEKYQWIRLEAPKKSQKVYGDQLLTWLLLRGLVLIELNRIGEAIMMFKLMECYKETAPRTKFATFVAYYHLAEIALQYDVCDYPLLIAAEYLKRASVYMQRAFDSKCYHYIHEYHPKISSLVEKLLTTS